MKIIWKLYLFFLSIAAVSILTISLLSFIFGNNIIEEKTFDHLNSVSTLKAHQINQFFGTITEDVESSSKDRLLIEWTKTLDLEESREQIRNLLQEKVDLEQGNFIEFFIINMKGEIEVSTNTSQEGKIKSDREYFINGREKIFLQPFYYSTSLQEPAVTAAAPLINGQEVIGVLAARVNVSKVSEIMLERSGLGDTGETYLVNQFNILITDSRFIKDLAFKKTVYTDGVKNCLMEKEGQGVYIDYRDIRVLGKYTWLPEINACLLTEIDEKEALSQVVLLRNLTFGLGLVLLLLSVGLIIYFSRKINQPISQLNEAAEHLLKKDFDVRLNIHTKDEFEKLGEAFNKAIEQLAVTEEQRKQIDKSKTEFLSITSHELRSPMTPMIGQLQMILKDYFGKLNKKQRESLQIVLSNTERLDRIIVDFLEISRIEAARLKFNFVKADLTKTIESVVKEMREFMPEKKIKFDLRIGKIPMIEVDPDRVSQILRNLINNAIKFTPDKGTIQISANQEKDKILFSVKDNGIGMSELDQRRLFEPFYQVDNMYQHKSGGVGLGLAICKGIVESQEGKIWIHSEPRKGTIFYFTLPLKPVKDMKAIRLLFSQTTRTDEMVEGLFGEYIGPMGKEEFEELKKSKEITSSSVKEYIDFLGKKKIIPKEKVGEFKSRIDVIFNKEKKGGKKSENVQEDVAKFFNE